MNERIAVFLCGCADNIAGYVDLAAVAEVAGAAPEVVGVHRHDLLCAPDGKAFVTDRLRRDRADRAVVAACSIREHEATFRDCLGAAGLNRYLLAMANIREHCTWVTGDRRAAEAKCLAMLTAAIARARLLEPLVEKAIDVCPDLMVIGGGVAGVEAALLAAQAGRHVTLVERGPSLGGRAAQIEDAAPNLDCTPCVLAPRLSAVREHPNIDLLTCSEVTGLVGYLGSFRATVARRARWIDPDLCMGCDECYQACPVEVANPFDYGLSRRKAVYMPFPGAVPNCVDIDREACRRSHGEDCAICRDACPMEAVDFDQRDDEIEVTAGALVIATGFQPHRPEALARLGHCRQPDLVTLPELERLLASDGPTKGKPILASGAHPRRIAVLHCVGRSELGYCSAICCASALKIGLLANKHEGETKAKVVHLHRDLVVRGPEDQALLARAIDKGGIELVAVSDVDRVEIVPAGQGYRLDLPPGSAAVSVEADMVVLVTGLMPSPTTDRLAAMLALRRDRAGFLQADHHFLRAVQTSVEGVEMAGCVTGPRNMSESIAQGHAAAGMAMAPIQPGRKLVLDPAIVDIEDDRCSGCLTCVSVCPYRANEVDPETGRPATNEVLCKGCGTCVAACPSGAAGSRHFSDRQLLAEIEGVLGV